LLFVHWIQSHWHLIHWGDASAYLGMVITAVFGVLAVRSSRRSKAAEREAKTAETEAKAQAERATKAATDAIAAAHRAATALERSAMADETQAKLAQNQADLAEQRPWWIDQGGSTGFRLHSRTDTLKYNVSLSGDPADARDNHFDVVHGRGPVALDLITGLPSEDRVVISWHPAPDHTGPAWTQPIDL
jgi:hypothetical protein